MTRPNLRLLERVVRTLDNSGGPPDDPHMEPRVKALEKFADDTQTELRTIDVRLAKIETRLDNFATKEDVKSLSAELHRELNATTWKIIGAMGLICAAVFWMARNIEPPQRSPETATSSAPSIKAPTMESPKGAPAPK
jgi:hypothetical protein